MKKVILFTSIFFTVAFFSQPLKAQTEAQRIELCTRSIQGATFANSFVIQFPAVRDGERIQEFKQGIALVKGNRYRFTLCNDDGLPGEAVIRVLFQGRVLVSNIHPETGALIQPSIDLDCSATGPYIIEIFFRDGAEGAAVCIFSHVRTL